VTTTGSSLSNQTSCATLFPGNWFGVEIDQDSASKAVYSVEVRNSSISDFSRSGILATGAGITVNIQNNWIAGIGPSTGVNQFGVFLANGAAGRLAGNTMTQGNCGSIARRGRSHRWGFTLDRRAMSFYKVATHAWIAERSAFEWWALPREM
jgi:hypothetical protein